MLNRNHFIGGLAVMLLLVVTAGGALAQEIDDAGWLATYWNNETLSGEPVLQRREAGLGYNWGAGLPAPEVDSDHFSARWQRYLNVEAGTYRFTASSDDGMRVWVDGDLIIDEWSDHPLQTVSADKQLGAGRHLIVVEYYEDAGGAVAQLTWQPVAANGGNWRGVYFNNRDLDGSPRLVQYDPHINFNWGTGSPAPDQIDPDNFSVRWTRDLNLPAGLYRFTLTVDDGARLWVNGLLLIDEWQAQSPSTYSADVNLPGEPVPVRLEYFEHTEGALVQLRWQTLAQAPEPNVIENWRGEYYPNANLQGRPTLIRDDGQINFDWGTASPQPGLVPADMFSARWQQTLDLEPDDYCFIMTVDDGGRLWVNGALLIDGWQVQQPQIYAVTVTVPGGPTPVRMEYFEHTGRAAAELQWLTADSPSLRNVKCD